MVLGCHKETIALIKILKSMNKSLEQLGNQVRGVVKMD